jgi:hypothetical protein
MGLIPKYGYLASAILGMLVLLDIADARLGCCVQWLM